MKKTMQRMLMYNVDNILIKVDALNKKNKHLELKIQHGCRFIEIK